MAPAAVGGGLAAASLYTTIAATAISVGMQLKQARRARAIGRRNALIAGQKAATALLIGRQRELKRRGSVAQLLGRQRALVGGSGAQIESESVLRIQEDVVALGEMDVLTIRNNAQREALGLRTQAQAFLFEGEGRSQEQVFGALGSAFSAAGSTISAVRENR